MQPRKQTRPPPGLGHHPHPHPHPWRRDRSSRLYPTHFTWGHKDLGWRTQIPDFPAVFQTSAQLFCAFPSATAPEITDPPNLRFPTVQRFTYPSTTHTRAGDAASLGMGEGGVEKTGRVRYPPRYPARPDAGSQRTLGAEEPEERRLGTVRGTRRCRGTHSAYPVAQGSRRVSLRMRMGRAMWSALHSTSS